MAAVLATLTLAALATAEPLHWWNGYGGDVETSYSIPTASTAAPTASGIAIFGDREYVNYTTVTGFFLQDENTTDASTFSYLDTNFGLINQTYPGQTEEEADQTQWQRFNNYVNRLNSDSADNIEYKLLFIGRHGEGYHNAAQTYYGTAAWDCYYAELDGNATVTWSDAHLDANGIEQAITNNIFWEHEIQDQKIQVPQSYYSSPLSRCLETANYTYSNLSLPSEYPFIPIVKELFRESISTHTCDRRSNKTYIHDSFPWYVIDPLLTEDDEIWNGVTAETSSAQDYRTKIILDEVFTGDLATVISITTHSGEGASLLRVLGHQVFALSTGAIIPILVKAETFDNRPPTVTTTPWTTNAWCTNGAPLSTLASGSITCICSDGVTATATSPPYSYASATTAATSATASATATA